MIHVTSTFTPSTAPYHTRTFSESSEAGGGDSGVLSHSNSEESINLKHQNGHKIISNGHIKNKTFLQNGVHCGDMEVKRRAGKGKTGDTVEGSDHYTDHTKKKTDCDVTDFDTDLPDSRQILKLNISGTLFEASLGTLRSIPGSRLSDVAKLQEDHPSYNPDTHMYHFERNPTAFYDIIEYYRSGELHLDQNGCGSIMHKELQYWRLCETDISMCCWAKYDSSKATTKMFEELDKLFDDGTSEITAPLSESYASRFRFYVFHTLESPSFSVGARIFSILSMLITFTSIFTFVAESHYVFKQIKLANGTMIPAPPPETHSNTPACCCAAPEHHETNHSADEAFNSTHNETELEHSIHDEGHVDAHIVFHYLDFFTFGYFLLELIVRFTFSYEKIKFCKSALNVVELICLTAHFISIIEHSVSVDSAEEHEVEQQLYLVFILRSLRIMRVARIFKLFRHMTGFKVLIYTIVVSFSELLLIISFLFAGVLIFAAIIHYAEEDTFPDIPFAIWWALVTMTTVGYGDVTPKSPMGYFIGSMCVVTGILVIAFTVPVVVNNFTLYYTLCKSRNSRLHMIRHLENEERKTNETIGVSTKSQLKEKKTPKKSAMNSIDVQSIT